MLINKELLQLTLKTIKENPQHWNQGYWHCGTSHCFAGTLELLYKGFPTNIHVNELKNIPYFYDEYYNPNTRANAMILLGLTSQDAYVLFHSKNTLCELEHYVNDLCEHGTITMECVHYTHEYGL